MDRQLERSKAALVEMRRRRIAEQTAIGQSIELMARGEMHVAQDTDKEAK